MPRNTLIEFLQYPLDSGNEILNRFAQLIDNEQHGCAIHEKNPHNDLQQFVYVPGKRNNKVVLIAHADTVWDQIWDNDPRYANGAIGEHIILQENNLITSGTPSFGIGADDRAGCAMLWLLRESGHSLLITNGEEHGQLGSWWIRQQNPDIFNELNSSHQFMIQLDRRNATDFKCYNVGTDEFRRFIMQNTNYSEPNRTSKTDIVVLCKEICGVNFSIGYYNEHHDNEVLNVDEWSGTLKMVRDLIGNNSLPRFPS